MGYDDVIEHLGDFGKYQKRIYFLICLPSISCAFHKLAGVFLLAKPEYRCLLPFENVANATYQLSEQLWNISYPRSTLTGEWQKCQYYDADTSSKNINRTMQLHDCKEFIYDTSHLYQKNNAVTEWNMVCGRSWMSATSDSMFMLGVLLGSIIFGQMSDKYGRKPIFFASLVIQLIFGVLAGIAPDYYSYTLSRLVVGATTSGVFLVSYVIAMEMVGPSYRLFAGVVCMMFFSVGFMLTGVFAYFIQDWRWLQIGLTLPGILFMSYYWFIPESARWLLLNNRKDATIANIKKAARVNKVDIPVEILDNLLEDSDGKPKANVQSSASVLDLLKHPNLRRKTLLIFFDWFVNSGTYYGLSWNTNNLGGNVLLNFVISGAVEIPAFSFLLLTLNRWGRRTILCGCMLVAGCSLLLTVVVPDNKTWLIITFAMIGKLSITASYGTVYIFSAEQFPTVIRNAGLGAASMVARIGGILAPFFNMLADIWRPFPLVIFGSMALIGGFLSLLLPETHNKPLLETIEDGENFGRKNPVSNDTEEADHFKVVADVNADSVSLKMPQTSNGLHQKS